MSKIGETEDHEYYQLDTGGVMKTAGSGFKPVPLSEVRMLEEAGVIERQV
jgi:hypothetical protein